MGRKLIVSGTPTSKPMDDEEKFKLLKMMDQLESRSWK
jgi:hypothetical protein